MASIGRIRLTISLDGDSTSEVAVEYTITFSDIDVAANVRYRETVRLIGDDPGGFPTFNDDDDLITLPTATVRPNGQSTLDRRIVRQVANSTLNEDPIGDDEVFARVCLRELTGQIPQVCRNSNTVTAGF